jgi:hypothetical protein
VETSRIPSGEFPFPLTHGPNESPFLTWLRNHSNYLAVRGWLDYFRMVAVLMRGILINNLVLIPTLLAIALAIALLYGSLLTDWNEQAVPAVKQVKIAAAKVRAATMAARVAAGRDAQEHPDFWLYITIPATVPVQDASTPATPALTAAREELHHAKEELNRANRSRQQAPLEVFLTKGVVDDTSGWVYWMQEHLGLTPPFLLTPLVLALAGLWVLLFPIGTMLAKVAGYRKSLTTGAATSVKSRDRYERSFGAALLVVLAVAVFELLPILVHTYHQARMKDVSDNPLGKYLLAATAALCALSEAPSLLAKLSGLWKVMARAVVALLGLFVPLLVIVLVTDFLVYVSMPVEHLGELLVLLMMAPAAVYAAVMAIVVIVGFLKQTFTAREYVRLFALLIGSISFHLGLLVATFAVYLLVWYVYQHYPSVVPDVLLSNKPEANRAWLQQYGDLAAYFVLAAALEIWLFCWLVVDVNLTSMHSFYRDRLASAYLLGVNGADQVDIEEDVPLSELCCHETFSTAPYHLINVALNLQGSKDIGLRDRASDFFIFSNKYIGGERTGYCRSTTMEQVFPQIDLASAMAISAAAASPNMGRGTSPALVAFMTLINARLGVWIPNPGLVEDAVAGHKSTGGKPGLRFADVFLDELVSIEKRWQNLGPTGNERRLDLDCRTIPSTTHGLAGLSFSGGGIRSATINLGIAQVLHDTGMFDHFDYMSTVSGGGYLGSSISVAMRNKTTPVSEIAGTVTVDNDGVDKIVTVTGAESGRSRVYRYAHDTELAVTSGDRVAPGSRLIRRPSARVPTFGQRFAWQVPPRALLREMTMRLNETYPWVNLSDGGHIENLAAIELLRRRCKFIVIGDGEADPNLHFAGLATLMRTAYIDLGIDIDVRLDELRLDENRCSKAHVVIGKIKYPGQGQGYLLYLKSSFTGDENEVIGEYRHRCPQFPHESTADQFFDEGQFEAYRALGTHLGLSAIEMLAPDRSAGKVTYAQFVQCFEALWHRIENCRELRDDA